ncbi:HTH domain-containing protein [Lederbergia sp. NSJ-179]|uniref:BglG family transcription antiterminator n=1 Tax=Lederbergia sp. NSJ-179 TaxID=2931402 RepID=UPI001FD1CA33|nr:HTH domain-containing protein [Lederbergia sp. NSJ-179]MCJ7841442.1 HTH domain-containing protein [Lederbergia sp. NSJ-179]
MHKKHNQLIDFLFNQNGDYVSATTLAEILGVTDRTIRNYVKEINDSSSDVVITSSSQGYAISTVDNRAIVQERVDANEKELEEAFLEFQIIQFLMNKNNYTTYDEIADKFFYSPQTIRSRIQKLTMDIQNLGIDVVIDAKVFKGIKLIGTEMQKRILLERFFTSISIKKEVYKDFVVKAFRSWVDAEVIENVFEMVDEINIRFKLNLEFQVYKKITAQLIIIIHQINHHALVSIEDAELTNLAGFKEFEVEEAFRSQLGDYVKMTDEEAIFLTNYLISLQLGLNGSIIENKDPKIISKIEAILLQVEQTYHVPVHSKQRFRNNISNHIYRIIYPASHNLLIYNPFVKEAKSQYFFSFSIASNIALQIEKAFLVEIQDSEIAYLAYHIQVILDSKDKRKIKTIILYSRSYERTKLLASKIATYFDELEICRIEKCSTDYVFDPSYLYIGINLSFTPQTTADFIAIQSGFQSSDIKKIRFFLEAQNSIIEQASIYWIHENSPEEAIRHLLSLNNQEHFYEPTMRRERISYTSIGNLVAIPHPYLEMKEYKETVIIGINNKAIRWGDELVQLIIIYIPSSDIERNEYTFTEVFQKTKSIKNVRKLVHAVSEKEFRETWNQI